MNATNANTKWLNSPIVAALLASLLAGLTIGIVGLTTLAVENGTRLSTLEKQMEERAANARTVIANIEDRHKASLDRASARLEDSERRVRELEIKDAQLASIAEELRTKLETNRRLTSRIEVLEAFRIAMNAYLGDLVSDVQAKEYKRMNQEELDRRIRSYIGNPDDPR